MNILRNNTGTLQNSPTQLHSIVANERLRFLNIDKVLWSDLGREVVEVHIRVKTTTTDLNYNCINLYE